MSLNANALVTSLSMIDLGSTVTSADLEKYINRASAIIEMMTGRELVRGDRTEVFECVGSDTIVFNNSPVVSINTVTVDGATMTSGDYELIGERKLVLEYGTFYGNATVEYTSGYIVDEGSTKTIPQDLQDACIELTKYLYWNTAQANFANDRKFPEIVEYAIKAYQRLA